MKILLAFAILENQYVVKFTIFFVLIFFFHTFIFIYNFLYFYIIRFFKIYLIFHFVTHRHVAFLFFLNQIFVKINFLCIHLIKHLLLPFIQSYLFDCFTCCLNASIFVCGSIEIQIEDNTEDTKIFISFSLINSCFTLNAQVYFQEIAVKIASLYFHNPSKFNSSRVDLK